MAALIGALTAGCDMQVEYRSTPKPPPARSESAAWFNGRAELYLKDESRGDWYWLKQERDGENSYTVWRDDDSNRKAVEALKKREEDFQDFQRNGIVCGYLAALKGIPLSNYLADVDSALAEIERKHIAELTNSFH
jgi:hypothetical protein